MAQNWAEKYSNDYTVCLQDGIWSVLKDGEGGKGLYRKGEFVCDLPSMYYYSDVFEGGIVLNATNGTNKTYMVFNNKSDNYIYKVTGKNITMRTEDCLIIFEDLDTKEELAVFDQYLFSQIHQTKDGQIGFDL